MAFLTEIKLPAYQAFEFKLGNCYDWHKFIWQFFIGAASRQFLFRVDDRDGVFRVYVVSAEVPVMPDKVEGRADMRYKEIPEKFLLRRRYSFEIRLNPVRTHVVRDSSGARKKNGRRLTVPPKDLPVWINEKFLKNGMRLLHDPEMGIECEISPITRNYFVKNGKRSFHSCVDVRGVLEVEDPEKFKKSFIEGIGHARAFGFGLLILK